MREQPCELKQWERVDLQLPGRRLRCACGHQLSAHDFDIIEPRLVRAVCPRCHTDLVSIEIWTVA
jgi:hypothetical protein